MNEAAISKYITDTFEGIEVFDASGNLFFFYDPERKFPFVTLVTNDDYDQFSNLNRPSVYRLNIGISKQTFRSLFGTKMSFPSADEVAEGGYDFTALDQLMPHPVYGNMFWVCVLDPSEATFQSAVQPLLAEAYEACVRRYSKRAAPR